MKTSKRHVHSPDMHHVSFRKTRCNAVPEICRHMVNLPCQYGRAGVATLLCFAFALHCAGHVVVESNQDP